MLLVVRASAAADGMLLRVTLHVDDSDIDHEIHLYRHGDRIPWQWC